MKLRWGAVGAVALVFCTSAARADTTDREYRPPNIRRDADHARAWRALIVEQQALHCNLLDQPAIDLLADTDPRSECIRFNVFEDCFELGTPRPVGADGKPERPLSRGVFDFELTGDEAYQVFVNGRFDDPKGEEVFGARPRDQTFQISKRELIDRFDVGEDISSFVHENFGYKWRMVGDIFQIAGATSQDASPGEEDDDEDGDEEDGEEEDQTLFFFRGNDRIDTLFRFYFTDDDANALDLARFDAISLLYYSYTILSSRYALKPDLALLFEAAKDDRIEIRQSCNRDAIEVTVAQDLLLPLLGTTDPRLDRFLPEDLLEPQDFVSPS